MSKVFFDSSISLDGYFAGENRSPQNPLGDDGLLIHEWMFAADSNSIESKLTEELFARTGAFILGKRMFEEGEVVWSEDLFKTDVFVLTHEQREPWRQKGTTTYYFINDGIESALEKAKASAQGKDVNIQGGANTIQQFLNAGLIDEFGIHIVPLILGSGIRLFDNIDKNKYNLSIDQVIPSSSVTHLKYKLTKK